MTEVIDLSDDDDRYSGGLADDEDDGGAGTSSGTITITHTAPLDLSKLLGGGINLMTQPRPPQVPTSNSPRYVPYSRPMHASSQVQPPTRLLTGGHNVLPNQPKPPIPGLRISLNGGVPRIVRPSNGTTQSQHRPQHSYTNGSNGTNGSPTSYSINRALLYNGEQSRAHLRQPIITHQNNRLRISLPSINQRLQLPQRYMNGHSTRNESPESDGFDGPPLDHPERYNPAPASRLNNYTFDAERRSTNFEDASTFSDESMAAYRFRCTYGSCCRLIMGNVGMMCHIWAHLVQWKQVETGDPDGNTDVDALGCCPQCLARFESPYLMQVHYTRAHSRVVQAISVNTCAICEKEVKDMRYHLNRHDPYDAPYRCPSCSYRCNIRMHLFDHFTKRHCSGGTLMCPFCTFSVTVNLNRRRGHALKISEYIYHMEKHEMVQERREVSGTPDDDSQRTRSDRLGDGGLPMIALDRHEMASQKRRIACDKCALCFTSFLDRQKHLKNEHIPLNGKFFMRARRPETRTRRRSNVVVLNDGGHLCNSCRLLPSGSRPKRCALCIRLAYSLSSAIRRLVTYTDASMHISTIDQLSARHGDTAKCNCGFESDVGQRIAAHFICCRRPIRIIRNPKKDDKMKKEVKEQTEAMQEEEKEELDLFAISLPDTKVPVPPPQELDFMEKFIKEMEEQEEETKRKQKGKKLVINMDRKEKMDLMRGKAMREPLQMDEAISFHLKITKYNFDDSAKRFNEMIQNREERTE